jgi:hypothetical protein
MPRHRVASIATAGCSFLAVFAPFSARAAAQATSGAPPCVATPTSLTPATWTSPAEPKRERTATGLRVVTDVALPGPTNRFDYQSLDAASGRLYVNHMNAGHTLVISLADHRVLADVPDLPRATGVWAVPEHHEVYVSAAGAHQVVVLDERDLHVVARVKDVRFPDGIAYAREADKVFVSDESGAADVAIDARTHAKRATIPLGGEAGNTHYDSVSHCILVAVQTRNELVAIDPVSERVAARYALPGSDHPHGFALDEPSRLAFVTGEGNGMLQVLDLRTMKVLARHRVGDDPDVLAWDPVLRYLYVAAESGVVTMFSLDARTLTRIADYRAPSAHTVSVDPRTHRVYLPLENVGGHPVLRVMEPAP